MHPTISYDLAQARIADLRRQAQRTPWPAPPAGRGQASAGTPRPGGRP